MPETNGTNGKTLLDLGPGVGSSVEKIKIESRGLRGHLAEELARDTTHFAESEIQLLKFHGSYQQEDRSQRQARKAAGLEPAYSMMLRLRIPGGALNAQQYLVLDKLADTYGNGTLRLTTRQSIQFHGILKGNLWATIHEINETLLSTRSACGDVNRNVMACPAPTVSRAAIGFTALADHIARHLAPRSSSYYEIWIDGERITEKQLAENNAKLDSTAVRIDSTEDEPIYGKTYLPRKFKIGIAYPGDNCIDIYTQDIGLIAELRGEGEKEELLGFNLVIGGGMGMTHGKAETHPIAALPFAYITPDEALEVITAIVTVQRDYGDRTNRKHARMKYVVEERGIPWFKEEVERRIGRQLPDPHDIRFEDVCDHLGWHEQPDGRWFLGISVENGRIHDIERPASTNHSDEQRPLALRSGLRTLLSQYGCSLRITPQQNLLLCDIAENDRADVERVLREHGVITDATELGIHRYAMACPALPTCGLALTDAERTLPALIDQVQDILNELGAGDERLSVRMTGCPNGCARPYMGDIGIVGRSLNLYDIFIGGDWENTRLNRVAFPKVKSADLIGTLRPAIENWLRGRNAHETFGDYYHRIGFDALPNQAVASALS